VFKAPPTIQGHLEVSSTTLIYITSQKVLENRRMDRKAEIRRETERKRE